jgi:hypothetical protein
MLASIPSQHLESLFRAVGNPLSDSTGSDFALVKQPPGRPTKYRPQYAQIVRTLAKHVPPTDSEIAEALSVGDRVIRNWKRLHPEFRAAFKSSIKGWVERTERSMWELANGYSVRTGEWKLTKEGEPLWLEFNKQFPPDREAGQYMLATHASDTYKPRGVQINASGDGFSLAVLVGGSAARHGKTLDASPSPAALPAPKEPEKVER